MGADREAFVSGYEAALRDLNGALSMERARIMYADPQAAALSAYEAAGEDWLAGFDLEANLTSRFTPTPRSRELEAGRVYVLAAEDGRVKIGWTAGNTTTRARQVQAASGLAVRLVGDIAGTREDEADVHYLLRADRLHGEWFTDSPAVRAWIEQAIA